MDDKHPLRIAHNPDDTTHRNHSCAMFGTGHHAMRYVSKTSQHDFGNHPLLSQVLMEYKMWRLQVVYMSH